MHTFVILMTLGLVASTGLTEQSIEQQTFLRVTRDRRESSYRKNYLLYTRRSGDVKIDINDHTLKLPYGLTRLPEIVDHRTLVVSDTLHEFRQYSIETILDEKKNPMQNDT